MSLTGAVPAHAHNSATSGGVLDAVQEVDSDNVANTIAVLVTSAGGNTEIVRTKNFTAQVGDWFICTGHLAYTSSNAITDNEIAWFEFGGSGVVDWANTDGLLEERQQGVPLTTAQSRGSTQIARCITAGTVPIVLALAFSAGSNITVNIGAGTLSVKHMRSTLAP